ncbi:lysylphosphatidylglycerol synthase domain-containing protein [Marinobacter sp.]|uniref:lysylphosphatidylglycerol synthase domain-containing protein n=1 Tax=Marinobacter sp. TaxID=50741 RepID=UPI0019CF25EB|nr:lysylphosphatidylglycerol synthase domain-containing protein [Marinobacter sp.]MBC7192838.1 hypothetical protein [Marinobacter sp.]
MAISLTFLGYALFKVDYGKLLEIDINYTTLSWSILASVMFRFLMTAIWLRSILNIQESITTFPKAINIYATSWVARYIPGGIFSHLGRVIMGKEQGITAKNSIQASIIETIMQVFSISFICALLLHFSPALIPRTQELKLISIAICSLAIIGLTPTAMHVVNNALSRLGVQVNEYEQPARIKFLAPQMGLYIAASLLANLAFLIFSLSIVGEASYNTISMILIANMAVSIASIMIILIPAGIGIREVGLVFFLMPILGTELAVAISLASRVWTIICDILFLLIAKAVTNAKVLNQ